ncbi:hypothetical protein niasHT_017217 [Heterodera trifolii]|uniref:Galectin domain-containing protein n=1 Tax=Heterodera trifolii TaxID=157864 RepID=A0ABD2L362_9BILA
MEHTSLSNSSENRQIEFVFAFTNYSYGIQINGHLLDDREFFPEEWWKGDYMNISQNFKYVLAGQFLLLHQPFVMDFTTIENNYNSPFFALPFYHSEPGVKQDSWATFHVEFFDPPENEFNISLLHDSPEHSEKVGATVMGMNVKPKDKQIDVIFWNCFKKLPGNKNSCNETKTKSYKNENLGKAAEFHIEVLNDSFSVIINGNQTMPLKYNSTLPVWATNFFRVEGNVRLLGRPIWKEWDVEGDEKGYLHNFSIPLKTLLNYGDQINLRTLIIGSETEFPQPFNITLLHEAAEWNEQIGDVILQLAFTFGDDSSPDKANQFICRNFIHARKKWEDMKKMPNHLNKFGQEFTMKIKANTDRFDIVIETLVTMEQIECKYPILDNVQIPPWAIDNIRFDGDGFRVTDFNISHPSPKALITNRINYIAQIKKKEIKTGNSISINLTFSTANKKHEKGKKSPLAVNLLNEGLSRHQKIGKTIIRLEFFPNGQIKDYYYTMEDKAEKRTPLCEQMAKWNSTLQNIFIQITITKESYDVKVNEKKCQTLHFNATLPPWALQYITIEFDEHQIDFSRADAQHGIKCDPENLCKMKQDDYDNYKTYLMEKEPESHLEIY